MNSLSSLASADGVDELVPREHSDDRSRACRNRTFRFEVLAGAAALADHAAAWDELAAEAIEPNIFHERWMLLPALDAYAGQAELMMVLAYAERPGEPPLLCGLFPLERARAYKGLPLSHLRLWHHKHCYLGTPLLRKGRARDCLAALLEWLSADPRGASFVEWDMVASDGAFFQALQAALQASQLPAFLSYGITRGVMRPRSDGNSFLAMAMPHKSLRELRRLERRLGEQGVLSYDCLDTAGNARRWIDEFLELEARGWKGRRGSALASNAENRAFFLQAADGAARLGRLMMMAMRLDGRAIAMKCNLLAADGGYAFKIAYDEDYARFSPGLLLELRHVMAFHERPALKWMDWCAEPDHFMANRLSLDRRSLATLVTATGGAPGKWLVSSLPALRWCRRRLRRGRSAAATSPGTPHQGSSP